MPIDPGIEASGLRQPTIATVRILRLALGTSMSLWFSQAAGWPLSFIAPVITMLILSMPVGALKLKAGIGLVVLLTGSLYAGTLLLPTLLNQTAVGVLLLALALYWSFYYTAKGGSPLLGTVATVGIALSTAVGSVSIDAVLVLIKLVCFATVVGVVLAWIAHALMPDSIAFDFDPPIDGKRAQSDSPDLASARWSAARSLLIMMPVALLILFSASSTAYVPVMLKVASMAQQATNQDTRHAARSLILSTVIGGAFAIFGWQLLSISPTLSVYVLFVGLSGLIMAPRIFAGAGLAPQASTWSYAYLTMLVILAPAVTDSIGGASAGLKFLDRLLMFAGTTLYAVVAVYVVDAFRAKRVATIR